jgi:two-component system chemotaxis response regulator CheY
MGKKIIVVDDSSTIRQQVSATLSEAGFEVVQATDGIDGIRTIEANQDASMVICDVNMPNMNGVQMLATVKANARYALLPIVMLTTEGDPALVKEARSAGAKGWLAKPFKPEMLLATVRKLTGTA